MTGGRPLDATGDETAREAHQDKRDRVTRPGLLASLLVTLVVLVGNLTYLLRIRSNNPLLYHSGLGSPIPGYNKAPFVRHGAYTIDGNDGWTAQSLGRLAAETWAHGHLPLWNLHEGLGQPLAGEMQSAAFFLPFVLFQLLPNGIFIMHVVLELVAGLTTLALLRRLGMSWTAAIVGGSLFGLNGAFSVMTNAPFNPIAFLPMTLWGVELVRAALLDRRRPGVGVAVISLALAWSLFSGFPETALIQGVFVGIWCLIRIFDGGAPRLRFALWCLLGSMVAVLLAAPILVSLRHFLSFGYTAYHGGTPDIWSYRPIVASQLAMPYLSGTFGKNLTSGVAGYVTLTALFMALLGFFGPRSRALRTGLGLLFLVVVLNMFGFQPANTFLNFIPGMKGVLIYKYALVLVEFVVILFAAYGLDDVLKGKARRSAVLGAILLVGAYATYGIWYVFANIKLREQTWTVSAVVAFVCALTILVAIAWRGPWVRSRATLSVLLAAFILIVESTASYAVPQLAASPHRPVDLAPVRFLQEHLGTSRFYSIGPIQPNYGSYWGLSQLNLDDLPVPQKTSDFIMKDLKPAPGTPAAGVTGWAFIPYELGPLNFKGKDAKGVLKAYGQEQSVYRQAAVKYLVTGHGIVDSESASRYGLRKVFSSPKAEIWEDAKAQPYYTTDGQCSTRGETLTSLTVDCPSAATLKRRQLASPGWHAKVGSTTHRVSDPPHRLYQEISVPKGTSKVTFTYLPSHFRLAVAASGLALLYVLSELAMGALRWGRSPHRR